MTDPEFSLKTGDPRFSPLKPALINGYRFVPAHLPASTMVLQPKSKNERDVLDPNYPTNFIVEGIDGLVIDWLGGVCPVQAEGKIDNEDFYFRSRGQQWEVWIGPASHHFTKSPDVWSTIEEYPDMPQYGAGWVSVPVALVKIAQAIALWRAHKANASNGD